MSVVGDMIRLNTEPYKIKETRYIGRFCTQWTDRYETDIEFENGDIITLDSGEIVREAS